MCVIDPLLDAQFMFFNTNLCKFPEISCTPSMWNLYVRFAETIHAFVGLQPQKYFPSGFEIYASAHNPFIDARFQFFSINFRALHVCGTSTWVSPKMVQSSVDQQPGNTFQRILSACVRAPEHSVSVYFEWYYACWVGWFRLGSDGRFDGI